MLYSLPWERRFCLHIVDWVSQNGEQFGDKDHTMMLQKIKREDSLMQYSKNFPAWTRFFSLFNSPISRSEINPSSTFTTFDTEIKSSFACKPVDTFRLSKLKHILYICKSFSLNPRKWSGNLQQLCRVRQDWFVNEAIRGEVLKPYELGHDKTDILGRRQWDSDRWESQRSCVSPQPVKSTSTGLLPLM